MEVHSEKPRDPCCPERSWLRRQRGALWPSRVPRLCEDTLATISSYSEPCFSKLTGDCEALRDVIFLARKQGDGQDVR